MVKQILIGAMEDPKLLQLAALQQQEKT